MDRQITEKYTGTQFNLWDEEWESGGINLSTGVNENATDRIRSAGYVKAIGSTRYYFRQSKTTDGNYTLFFYDDDKNYISYTQVSVRGIFETPSNCGYIRFRTASSYGNTYNNDICINISQPDTSVTPHNGDYVPHQKSKNYVVLETCGQVLFQQLDWGITGKPQKFYTSLLTQFGGKLGNGTALPFLDALGYTNAGYSSIADLADMKYSTRDTGIIYLRDDRYATTQQFTQVYQDYVCNFELANPKPHAIKNVITI